MSVLFEFSLNQVYIARMLTSIILYRAEFPKMLMLDMYYSYYFVDYELYRQARGELYIFGNKEQEMKYFQHLFLNSV